MTGVHFGTSTCSRCHADYNTVDDHICADLYPPETDAQRFLKCETMTRIARGIEQFNNNRDAIQTRLHVSDAGEVLLAAVDVDDADAIINALPDPNDVGSAEYAALHDMLSDMMWDPETSALEQMMESMDQVVVHALTIHRLLAGMTVRP
jgi:hypothetical protein